MYGSILHMFGAHYLQFTSAFGLQTLSPSSELTVCHDPKNAST